jgi:dephospho-CoA kinase
MRAPDSLGRISVVGPCASGKSTLVRALRMHGYDAHVTSQEHSAIPTLWSRQEPQLLIALQADLESVRLRRRNPRWSRAVWQAQQGRLADAFEHADFVADTSDKNANQVVRDVLEFLESRGTREESE